MLYTPQILLFSLAIYGYIALHQLGRTNGFFDLLEVSAADGSTAREFSSVKPVDDLANFFLAFFWPCVDGNHPGLSLTSLTFAGQWVAGWTMMVIEGSRQGNVGTMISFVSIFGVLYQSIGLAVIAPIYLLLHLLTSPSASNPTAAQVTIPTHKAISIPLAVTLGYIVPTILMSLPSPAVLSDATKANLVLFWQFFPLWTSLLHLLFSSILRQVQITVNPITAFRVAYVPAILLSTVLNLASVVALTVMLFSPVYANDTAAAFKLPPWPLDSTVKAESIAGGSLWFLQYDYLLTSAALLVWALALKVGGKRGGGLVDGVQGVLVVLGSVLARGPMGAALNLVRERDEAVLLERTVGGREGKKRV